MGESTGKFGFRFGDAFVERLFEYKGHVAVRVRSFTSGRYVDIQISKTGRSFSVSPVRQEKSLKGKAH